MKKSLVYSFIISVFLFFGMHIVLKDNDYSDNENRKLKQFPKITVETIFNGEFREDFEKYIADQFPLRDIFVGIKSYSEKIIGKKENNGVYISSDDYFIQKMNPYKEDLLEKNVGYINDLSKEYNVSVAIAPTALSILSEKLPSYSEYEIENEYINKFYSLLDGSIKGIDLRNTLKEHNKEYIYYKTDHHWTSLGAYYAYKNIIESLGQNSIELEDYNILKYSDEFLGTLYSKGNFLYAKKDKIDIYEYIGDSDIKVEYVYTDKVSDSFYEDKYLSEKDKYNVFFGGNQPAIKITNSLKGSSKIAILKDSYANSLVPFLSNHYGEIHMIDLRQFNGDVRAYLNDNDIKDVLILYNANGISTDNNLYKTKKRN